LINNEHYNILNIGEVFSDWKHLLYGLSEYNLPVAADDELISKIHIRGYSKEDNSLVLDSTVTFDYQVDTLNK